MLNPRLSRKGYILLGLFLLFWGYYFLKLAVYSFFGEPLGQAFSTYLFWGVGSCVLPFLAVFFAGVYRAIDFKLLVCFISLTSALVGVLVFLQFKGLEMREGDGRVYLERLNPILIGHLAASAVLCLFWYIKQGCGGWLGLIISSTAILLCAFLLAASGSKGPLVSLLIAFVFLFWFDFGKVLRKPSIVFILVAIMLGLVFFIDWGSVLGRFSALLDGSDESGVIRIVMWKGAIQEFLSNPLFGGYFEEQVYKYYPHNIVLEAFMVTGLFGGVAFVLLLVSSLIRSATLLSEQSVSGILALLYVQYLIGSLFSGSIYSSSAFWVLMAAVFAADSGGRSSVRRFAW